VSPNTVVVHAGDAVQGSLYFSLFAGKVEFPLLNMMPYDYIIMGNHEFDNGIERLAEFYKDVKPTKLSANYDFRNTPLHGMFKPFDIREYNGKRVAFMGINLNPKGIIAEEGYKGLVYSDCEKIAHLTAAYLKNVEHADYVVMVSHIGYDPFGDEDYCDEKIAKESTDIDLILSAHSHTLVKPNTTSGKFPGLIANKNGKLIPVVQSGRSGKYMSEITIDLETGDAHLNQIKVDKRFDKMAHNEQIEAFLAPFTEKVDSLMHRVLVESSQDMINGRDDWSLSNWLCDIILDIAKDIYKGPIDFSIMNRGGIRQNIAKGAVTQGLIMSMLPFSNNFVAIKIKGSDLLDALKVMAKRGGDSVSKQLYVEFTKNGDITKALYNGKAIEAEKYYNVLTIDYLANGGDYMEPFIKSERLFTDNVKYGDRVLPYLEKLGKKGKKLTTTKQPRMICK
ncbi:MAG: 5'-nucleotidase C-terminal domain-containing protein, partial [Bacteroidaceae bacterium]|nr:5'-nucleotidase C-terminal domain-containing protein [Bacteroidaceae bacterium]